MNMYELYKQKREDIEKMVDIENKMNECIKLKELNEKSTYFSIENFNIVIEQDKTLIRKILSVISDYYYQKHKTLLECLEITTDQIKLIEKDK